MSQKPPAVRFVFTIFLFIFLGTTPYIVSAPQAGTAGQAIDKEYTRLLKEATTKPEFLSPLIEYLPRVKGIPTPKDVLGYIAGAPGKLTYYADIIEYMHRLADASARVQIVPIGKTWEGREMVIVVISDEANMNHLEENKNLLAQLSDPRIIKTETEARTLIARIIPTYLLTCNLHSPESGAAEAALEMAYRLAVDESDPIKTIRSNMITLIIPSAEPDGHDKHTDWFYKYHTDIKEYKKIRGVPYWGRYDLHDNNRDMITMSNPEMRNIAGVYYEWLPIVLQDNHESVPYLFFSSANGPSNFPATMDSERNLIAWWEVTQMNAYGMPGVHTHDFGNTSWSPNFMASIASNHNSTFHFYETFGNAIANTMEREVGERRRKKDWFRPIPPYEKVLWSLRNNLNYQITGNLLAKYIVASQKDFFLMNFWKRGYESYTKVNKEPPYAYIVPAEQTDPEDTVYLLNVLLRQKIELHRSQKEIKLGKAAYPAGSYVVRLDQPYANLARNLLGIQQYPKDATPAYDDCGWTLGLNMGVETIEIKDKTILEHDFTPVIGPVKLNGSVKGGKARGAYIINNGTNNSLLTARIRLARFSAWAAEEPFKIKDLEFAAGSLIFPIDKAIPELHKTVSKTAAELGLTVHSSSKLPQITMHELDIPRVAIFHTWASTQDDGWVRLAFDQLDIPFKQIHKDHIRAGDLKNNYDVIIFSSCRGRSGADIINGIDPAHRGPLAYVKSAEFKHLGTPDSSEDITGGIGLEGVVELKQFVEDGGLLLALNNAVRVPIDFGLVRGIGYFQPSAGFFNPGSLIKSEILQEKHPVTYGYDKELAILRRASGPLLNVADELKKHIIVSYAKKGPLCLSGLVKNEKNLSEKAAIIDMPVGQGRILFFTFNPFWRDTNHAVYMFVFNAILNYNDFAAGYQKE